MAGMVYMSLIPALKRQTQANIYEFETSLVYKASSKTVRATYRKKTCLGGKKSYMSISENQLVKKAVQHSTVIQRCQPKSSACQPSQYLQYIVGPRDTKFPISE